MILQIPVEHGRCWFKRGFPREPLFLNKDGTIKGMQRGTAPQAMAPIQGRVSGQAVFDAENSGREMLR